MKDKKFFIQYLLALMSLSMIVLVIITSMQSDLFHLPSSLVNAPWFRTTLVDFYFNITIISLWVISKEDNKFIAALWIIAFVLLGSIATALYAFLQIIKLKPEEPWGRLFSR